jgi:cell division protein FtsB
MRWLAGFLLLLLLALQYRLWVGEGSLAEVEALRGEIVDQKAELKSLRTRNQAMEAEVQDLREGLDALEERARSELGMIKHGEVFLQVIEEPEPDRPGGTIASPDADAAPAHAGGDVLTKSQGGGGLARREVTGETTQEP